MAQPPAVAPVSRPLEEVIAQLQGPDSAGRYYAAWHLGTMGDPRAVPALILALADEADRTELGGYPLRRAAAKALGLLGDRQAVPALVAALACDDFYVREEAAWALGQLGDQGAIAPLHSLLIARDSGAAAEQPWEAVIESLGQLTSQPVTGQAVTTQLAMADLISSVRPFLTHESARVQAAAAWVLYRWTGDEALTGVLVQLVEHESVHLRRAALFDLAESGWLGGAGAIAQADAAVNLRLNALQRLATVALDSPPDLETMKTAVAAQVIPWLDQLL